MSRITHAGAVSAPALGGRLTRAIAVVLASCFAVLAMTGAPAMAADSSQTSEPVAVVQQSDGTGGSDLSGTAATTYEHCTYYRNGNKKECWTITNSRMIVEYFPDVEAVATR